MKLINQELAKQIPALYSQEENKDPKVYLKFFTPWSNWTWYVTEFDGTDTFFGLVKGLEQEWGYFSLSELENVCGPYGLRIERDLYFSPKPISQVLGKAINRED